MKMKQQITKGCNSPKTADDSCVMMDIYDFGSDVAQTYRRNCECGEIIEVSTKQDSCPEYYTDIFIKCNCGKSVHFTLPVN